MNCVTFAKTLVLKRGLEITPYDLDIRFSSTEVTAQSVPSKGVAVAHLSVEENEKGFYAMHS